ncbi:AAA family ATPase [bacterium]|nr:AAA family ATPase [bacterium]
MRARVDQFSNQFQKIRSQLQLVVVGQPLLLDQVLWALVAGGNVLLEGVPGLGKTLLVKSLGQVLDLSFARCQFTPDLMPSDILGTQILDTASDGSRHFRFQPGPVFTHLLLADEINRATPKTQSALLEAMQERQVTVAGKAHTLPEPFFVLATQNPIDMEGTYPLPEAQVDRFLFKLLVEFPSQSDLASILDLTTGVKPPTVEVVCSAQELLEMQTLARDVAVAPELRQAIARLIRSTHPQLPEAGDAVHKYVRYGSSPRGAQSILLAAKARALSQGRLNVSLEDVQAVALPCLRHRILPSFEGEAEGIGSQALLQPLIDGLQLEVKA